MIVERLILTTILTLALSPLVGVAVDSLDAGIWAIRLRWRAPK